MRTKAWRGRLRVATGMLLLLLVATAATAQDEQGPRFFRKGTLDGTADGMTEAQWKAAFPEYYPVEGSGAARPSDIPDVYGPGAVLSVGNVFMKVTNWGFFGNPLQNLSSDPSCQWPGASGIEYMNLAGLAIGAVNPFATDPNAIRRVSAIQEWRPPTLDPVDRMYRSYDGILGGARFTNDDGDKYQQDEGVLYRADDPRIDEDFLDGIDNDQDGQIDEDYGALGQQTFTCRMRDDTPQAINATTSEKHVPLGIEVQQMAWAYSIPGFTDFNVVQYTIYNRSGHELDTLVVGGLVDMDCGPVTASSYWQDDKDLAGYPSCLMPHKTAAADKRIQDPTMRERGTPNGASDDSSLCPQYNIRINGFSVVDDDGDLNRTKGLPTFLLVDHTIDPLEIPGTVPPRGATGPSRVGFLAFRSYTGNTPYVGGGGPRTDQQRYEFMAGFAGTNIGEDGFINQERGEEKGDYQAYWSCGPWYHLQDNGRIQVTVALTVAEGDKELAYTFANEYKKAADEGFPGFGAALLSQFPSLANAYAIQVAFDGIYEQRPDWPWLTNGFGRETPVHPTQGEGAITTADCRDQGTRTVTYANPVDWFDYDCNYCTGAYNGVTKLGMFHRTWNADAPPPNPNMNVSAQHNFSDNPSRIIPAGDNMVTVAWDNISEVTADPKTGWLDLRGYRVWKAANWQRPVGSAGPSDNDWSLLGEFLQYHEYVLLEGQGWTLSPRNYTKTSPTDSVCPRLYVPSYSYPVGSAHCPNGCVDSATVDICLSLDDLWNRQSGEVIRASAIDCVRDTLGNCNVTHGCINGRSPCDDTLNWERRTRYPVGRYQLVDREVKNGFVYFYSVTAFDSTGFGQQKSVLEGRRSATESDGVVPQASTRAGKNVWVVPNPYRGYRNIADRPSSWDLTPNGSDPTGTHVDFLGLPRGKWVIKIFTVSGDWVQTLRSDDPINESIRTPVGTPDGGILPGYNRQQDNPDDGEARWNLISRNGQDIVSGIYLFTVESDGGMQRGKFVVIR